MPTEKLIRGYKHFRAELRPPLAARFETLAGTQSPEVLLITCADSRVVPNLILDADPGELFIARNAGNVVPPPGERDGGTAATIEYAVDVLKVKHAVVCGHSDCGAVRAAANPEAARDLPLVRPWLEYVRRAQEAGGKQLENEQGDPLRQSILANVLGQLVHLEQQPSVARAVAEGRLQTHAWFFDIATGAVERYHPSEERFVPLELS